MLIIGDIHGKISQFLDLVSEYRKTSKDLIIQLGDLGFQKQWDEVINGTQFICLAELQTYEL